MVVGVLRAEPRGHQPTAAVVLLAGTDAVAVGEGGLVGPREVLGLQHLARISHQGVEQGPLDLA